MFSTFERPLPPTTPTDTPPKRKRRAELSGGRRTAMAVEIALAIPPGHTGVPKGILGPLVERYGVGPRYPKNIGPSVKLRSTKPGGSTSQTNLVVGGRHFLPQRKSCAAEDQQGESVVHAQASVRSAERDRA